MLKYGRQVREHTAAGRQVLDDELSQHGVLYELAIIGEAAGRVSDEVRQAHPEVPWPRIVAQRNILVHVYDHLNLERVWVAVEAMPELERQLTSILEEMGKP
jgi:uncharacterized protein with HEPN domain